MTSLLGENTTVMGKLETYIDFVNLFLQGKSGNVLSIIEDKAKKFIEAIKANETTIENLEKALSNLASDDIQQAYKKLLAENKQRFETALSEKESTLKQLHDTHTKLERLNQNAQKDPNLPTKINETKKLIESTEAIILALKNKNETNLESLKIKHETFLNDLQTKN